MEEEQEHQQIPETFVYETLSPLSLSSPAAAADDSDNLEQYSVFRNEISLSTPQCASPYSTAPDFFSLDVAGELSGGDPLPEPVTPAEPKTPALAPEPKLESGWFRGNCKFRSPMLQLHKGTELIGFCFGACVFSWNPLVQNRMKFQYSFFFIIFFNLCCDAWCAEIVDFCEFLSPTPEEKAKRDVAIESVFEVIKHIWPHCQVMVII